jgi:hypothetical protein
MRFPPFDLGPIIATVSNPLGQLGGEQYARLNTEAWPASLDLETRLRGEPYGVAATYLGLCGLGLTRTWMRAAGHWWLLETGCVELSARDKAVAAMLADAGHEFDPKAVRIARRMWCEWDLDASMHQLGERTYRGRVTPPDSSSIALPFIVNGGAAIGGQRWAAYLAVHVPEPKVVSASARVEALR